MSDNLLSEARGEPTCITLVLCNEVIEDKFTNNKSLISLFNAVQSQTVPTRHPRMVLMASFTGGKGIYTATVIIRAPSGKEIVRLQGPIHLQDPTGVFDLVINLQGTVLPEFGTYFIDVLLNESMKSFRQFTVLQIPGQGG